jgi:hypothetical protein
MPVDRRAALEPLLIEPFSRQLEWEYSKSADLLQSWVLAWQRQRDVQLVFCDKGFGPEYPWGFIDSKSTTAGRDDSWYKTLDDAFINSGLWIGKVPEGYEVS